jgi:hypothetical protein
VNAKDSKEVFRKFLAGELTEDEAATLLAKLLGSGFSRLDMVVAALDAYAEPVEPVEPGK